MYTLIRTMTLRALLTRQAPVVGLSVILAELFYKFHSFTLEAGAFLGTWFVIDFISQCVRPSEQHPRESVTNCE